MIAARQYSSVDEMMANYARIKRTTGPSGKAPARTDAAQPLCIVQPSVIAPKPPAWAPKPLWKKTPIEFDQHVIDMRVAVGEIHLSPMAFLRRRCRVMGIDFEVVVGKNRSRRTVIPYRHALILEVKQQYPQLSLPQLGRLFGGRDHTTILHALRKQGWTR